MAISAEVVAPSTPCSNGLPASDAGVFSREEAAFISELTRTLNGLVPPFLTLSSFHVGVRFAQSQALFIANSSCRVLKVGDRRSLVS